MEEISQVKKILLRRILRPDDRSESHISLFCHNDITCFPDFLRNPVSYNGCRQEFSKTYRAYLMKLGTVTQHVFLLRMPHGALLDHGLIDIRSGKP